MRYRRTGNRAVDDRRVTLLRKARGRRPLPWRRLIRNSAEHLVAALVPHTNMSWFCGRTHARLGIRVYTALGRPHINSDAHDVSPHGAAVCAERLPRRKRSIAADLMVGISSGAALSHRNMERRMTLRTMPAPTRSFSHWRIRSIRTRLVLLRHTRFARRERRDTPSTNTASRRQWREDNAQRASGLQGHHHMRWGIILMGGVALGALRRTRGRHTWRS